MNKRITAFILCALIALAALAPCAARASDDDWYIVTAVMAAERPEGAEDSAYEAGLKIAADMLPKRLHSMDLLYVTAEPDIGRGIVTITAYCHGYQARILPDRLWDMDDMGRLSFIGPDGDVFMDASHVQSVECAFDTLTGMGYHIALTLTEEGAAIFAEMTGKSIGRQISIMLGNEILMAPIVNERIEGGRIMITGGFSKEVAERYAALIGGEALPLHLTLRSVEFAEPDAE